MTDKKARFTDGGGDWQVLLWCVGSAGVVKITPIHINFTANPNFRHTEYKRASVRFSPIADFLGLALNP